MVVRMSRGPSWNCSTMRAASSSRSVGFDGERGVELLAGPVVVAQSDERQAADQGPPEVLGVGEEAGLSEHPGVIADDEPVEGQMDVLVPGVVGVEPVRLADALQALLPGTAERQQDTGPVEDRRVGRAQRDRPAGVGLALVGVPPCERHAGEHRPRVRVPGFRVSACAPGAQRRQGPHRGPAPTAGSRSHTRAIRASTAGRRSPGRGPRLAQSRAAVSGVLGSYRCRGGGSRRAWPRVPPGRESPRGARWRRAAPPRGSRRRWRPPADQIVLVVEPGDPAALLVGGIGPQHLPGLAVGQSDRSPAPGSGSFGLPRSARTARRAPVQPIVRRTRCARCRAR